ncbi:universal stress protein [Haloarcula japonica]|uniref:universal stress protein n=1 Tax=Haloarcula japonica TaxID=29282 RepID=UPI0039F6FC77
MYESVLIPTDGSGDMREVADHAIALAERCEAVVHVLHVVDDRAYGSIPDDVQQRVEETLTADGEDATKAIAQRALNAGLDTVREVRWGNPPAGIVAYATENDISLIIMGTHGRTGYDRYLLGSVTEKVVRVAPMPVLTVSVGDEDEDDEPLVGISMTDSTQEN